MEIKPNEFSYEIFQRVKHDYTNIKTTYSLAWEYTLIVKIFIEVSTYFKENRNIKKNRENIDLINDFLIKYNYKEDTRNLKIFYDYLKNILDAKANLNFKVDEYEAKIGDKNGTDKLLNLLYFGELSKPKNALKTILQSHQVYIFLDELDAGWDNTDEAKNYINGLFNSVYSLSSTPGLNIFVSLRQDMYNNLIESLTNGEKIREDIEKLHWDKKSLKALIARRISVCIPEKLRKNFYTDETINLVFEENVFDFILEHTLNRPREVIEFCNRALDEYINTFNQHHNSQKKIDLQIIDNVLIDFSTYRIQDICKEYQYEYPHVKEILYAFEHGLEFYSLVECTSVCEKGIFKLVEKYGEVDWLRKIEFDPHFLIELLFNIGFLQIYIPNDNKYLAFYETNILDFSSIDNFKINNVFVSALKCKKN